MSLDIFEAAFQITKSLEGFTESQVKKAVLMSLVALEMEGVREMLRIAIGEDSTEDERRMALLTVADLLFPDAGEVSGWEEAKRNLEPTENNER